MYRAEVRRVRDRKFIPYDPSRHLVRAFSVAPEPAIGWDLFPPPRGYRPFSSASARTYAVSHARQHRDWSELVLQRDRRCTRCGAQRDLEAHHVWPQIAFGQLRYLLANGLTLCISCHDSAYHAQAITPAQFEVLAAGAAEVNSRLDSDDFWAEQGVLARGRAWAFGLRTDFTLGESERDYFLIHARLNRFVDRVRDSVESSPIGDAGFSFCDEFLDALSATETGGSVHAG